MVRSPRWNATKTRRQSRNLAVLYAVIAVLGWVAAVGFDASGWWSYVLAIVFTLSAAIYLLSWRLWQDDRSQ